MTDRKKASQGNAAKKIILVDDHPMIRQGIRMLVSQEAGLEVCGEAEDAAGALRVIEDTQPDLAIVDLTLKNSSGLELIKDIHIRWPALLILVLSMRDEGFFAERVLRAGAQGYVTKEEGPAEVMEGIRKILAGELYLSAKMSSKLIGRFVGGGKAGQSSIEALSDRELEVLELLGRGLPTRDIAEKLHLSVKTIDAHREHIKEKLKIDNAAELIKYAIEWIQNQRDL